MSERDVAAQRLRSKKSYDRAREDIDAYRAKKNAYAKTPVEREKRRIWQQNWRDANRDKYNEWSRARYRKNRADARAANKRSHLKKKYGLTEEALRGMLADQANRCAICFNVLTRAHIDHDHETGKVRGILCPRCNAFLGQYEKRDMAVVEAYLFGLPKRAIA
jgi:hypothetical protein